MRSFRTEPRGPPSRLLSMTPELPPLRPLGTARISCEPLAGHPSYAGLLADATTTGCCPVWVSERGLETIEPRADPAPELAALDGRDAAGFLAEHWPRNCPLCGCRDGFGTFAGLAAPTLEDGHDALAAAGRSELVQRPAHLALVPVRRPADTIVALGWSGTCNAHDDLVGLSSVLRSWEERYGAVLVEIDFMTLWVSVAAPPRTPQECRAVAAEHFAFCPDVDWEDPRPLDRYAADLAGRSWWRFWWD